MRLARRKFLHLATGALALPAISRGAWAQSYPTKPVTIVVPVPAGSAPDVVARIIGQWLQERLGQPVVMDPRPGASGHVATQYVARATPDGYTLLFSMGAMSINAALHKDARVSFLRDTQLVASLGPAPLVLELHPSIPATNIPELIAYAKANPGKINMASSGNATPLHVAGELFQMSAGVKFTHIPYRGEPMARADLLEGRVQVLFGALPTSLPVIRSGKMRGLGVTTLKRLEAAPEIPAIAEFLPGFEGSGNYGIAAPKGTPREIVDRLNREINAGLADPKVGGRLVQLGMVLRPGTPEDFEKYTANEIKKWSEVIDYAGIKP